jgi:hypothetical protein
MKGTESRSLANSVPLFSEKVKAKKPAHKISPLRHNYIYAYLIIVDD